MHSRTTYRNENAIPDVADGPPFIRTHDPMARDSSHAALFLIRNPFDVIRSQIAFEMENGYAMALNYTREETFRRLLDGSYYAFNQNYTWHWQSHVLGWFKRDVDTVLVRFEDLIDEPIKYARKALAGLNIDREPTREPRSLEELREECPLNFSRNEHPHLSRDEVAQIVEKWGRLIGSLGYHEEAQRAVDGKYSRKALAC
ncbi:MAG: sulfotransferase domain-containing protein [Acidimicrobiia bacterium]|nr:sulfotransferase domain-containing protein [Acidimicrobiia bacterium]